MTPKNTKRPPGGLGPLVKNRDDEPFSIQNLGLFVSAFEPRQVVGVREQHFFTGSQISVVFFINAREALA